MGALVTRSVPDFHLAIGSPARSIGVVCKCGQLFHKFSDADPAEFEAGCTACDLRYKISDMEVNEL
jgi:hypothetical protein